MALLAKKHAADVFVPECKDGRTGSAEHARLDAWAMKRSWAKPCVDGYEVKVSRSDFVKDDKWQAYLPLCNQFWFACPAKLIAPEELPPDVGLLWVSSTGGSLFTKRKAVWRKVDIPESLWRYIVMCRAKIAHTYPFGPDDTADYWRRWIGEKAETRALGQHVAQSLREKVETTEGENKRLKKQMAEYDDIRKTLSGLGVDPDSAWCASEAKWKVEKTRQLVPPDLVETLRRLAGLATRTALDLEKALEPETKETPT